MQPYSYNPIEQRKKEVHRNARNAALCVVGGVGGGVVLALLATSWFWLILGGIVAVAGGGYYWSKVRKGIDPKHGVGY